MDREVRLRNLTSPKATFVEQADRATSAGNLAEAEKLLLKASEVLPDDVSVFLKLAALQRASGHLKASLASVHRALSISPLDFTALLFRASLLDRLNDAG